MLRLLRAFAVCLLFATAGAALAADAKPFAREDMASDAARLAETLKTMAGKVGAQTAGKTPEDLRKGSAAATASRRSSTSPPRSRRPPSTVAPKDPANWLAFANVAIKADDTLGRQSLGCSSRRGRPRPTRPMSARSRPDIAGAGAGERSATPRRRHSVWRGARSTRTRPRSTGGTIPTSARPTKPCVEQYGFRILDYKVDNEFDNPPR